jgi:hypothetical protein
MAWWSSSTASDDDPDDDSSDRFEELLWEGMEAVLRPTAQSASSSIIHIPDGDSSRSICRFSGSEYQRLSMSDIPRRYSDWNWCHYCKSEYFDEYGD